MTHRDEIKRRTEIQQAWLDGETIEYGKIVYDGGFEYGVDRWKVWNNPSFNWEKLSYRVKPKVYVKPEDLEVGKTYRDESGEFFADGIGGTMTILCKDDFHFGVRVATIPGTCPRRCFMNTRRIGYLKLIEVQEDGQ